MIAPKTKDKMFRHFISCVSFDCLSDRTREAVGRISRAPPTAPIRRRPDRESEPLLPEYERDRDGLPRGWIKRMKRTIRTLGWRFNADRMVMDYTQKCYVPAAGGTSSDMRVTL